MEKFLIGLGAAILVSMVFFFVALLTALLGALAGWSVEHSFLAQYVLVGFDAMGWRINPGDLPALGAALGFVGAFFRSSTSTSKSS
jgi:hypothetical protein